jgi:hypothetical protein
LPPPRPRRPQPPPPVGRPLPTAAARWALPHSPRLLPWPWRSARARGDGGIDDPQV